MNEQIGAINRFLEKFSGNPRRSAAGNVDDVVSVFVVSKLGTVRFPALSRVVSSEIVYRSKNYLLDTTVGLRHILKVCVPREYGVHVVLSE